MISVQNVSKRFGNHQVLNQVSIDFIDGQIAGIIGRNGSGKTVLLKCIIGLMRPDQGRIIVDGLVIGQDTDFAQNLGFIIDRPGFLSEMSGYKNLRYIASIKRLVTKEQIIQALVTVGLDPSSKKGVGKYSMGMKGRLALAQALMEDPSLLILDEPMNGLDQAGVHEMRDLLKRLRNDGKTIILTSHNAEDIEVLSDRTYRMEAGQVSSGANRE